jgi:hypothetical protein
MKTFELIASELALLSDKDRGEFATFLYKNYQYTAENFMRELGFADMDTYYSSEKVEDFG